MQESEQVLESEQSLNLHYVTSRQYNLEQISYPVLCMNSYPANSQK